MQGPSGSPGLPGPPGRDGYTNVKSAFFVALNGTYLLKSESSIIIWDDVLLNKNNHLNNNTGIYYAPINGLYEFSLTVCVPANHIVRSLARLAPFDSFVVGIGLSLQEHRERRSTLGGRLSDGR